MRGLAFALAVFSIPSILTAEEPSYSATSLVNSADNQAGWLASGMGVNNPDFAAFLHFLVARNTY